MDCSVLTTTYPMFMYMPHAATSMKLLVRMSALVCTHYLLTYLWIEVENWGLASRDLHKLTVPSPSPCKVQLVFGDVVRAEDCPRVLPSFTDWLLTLKQLCILRWCRVRMSLDIVIVWQPSAALPTHWCGRGLNRMGTLLSNHVTKG